MYTERLANVRGKMADHGLEQLLVTDKSSIFYLTGYDVDPMERFYGLALTTDDRAVLVANRLFPDASAYVPEVVVISDTDDVAATLAQIFDPDRTLGVDKTLAARWLLPMMDAGVAAGYVLGSAAVDEARAVKTPAEVDLMRAASELNDAGMEWLLSAIDEGVTERELADGLLDAYLELGADGFSFEPIISFGANAADPHHEPDDTALAAGDVVLFDVGCKKDGWCADMTRTFFYGEPTDEQARVYAAVAAANAAGEAAVKPGATCADVDAATRAVLEEAGLGELFTHRTGHGIGIDVHEFLDISGANGTVLEPGMIFSVEPGAYIDGDFGVRVEDLVVVTEDGCEVLNKFSKDLVFVEP
jgi:Xaa-Pro dipeptidase